MSGKVLFVLVKKSIILKISLTQNEVSLRDCTGSASQQFNFGTDGLQLISLHFVLHLKLLTLLCSVFFLILL